MYVQFTSYIQGDYSYFVISPFPVLSYKFHWHFTATIFFVMIAMLPYLNTLVFLLHCSYTTIFIIWTILVHLILFKYMLFIVIRFPLLKDLTCRHFNCHITLVIIFSLWNICMFWSDLHLTAQNVKFWFIWSFAAYLFTFTKEILQRKFNFLHNASSRTHF